VSGIVAAGAAIATLGGRDAHPETSVTNAALEIATRLKIRHLLTHCGIVPG
jgi:hypothetical protein